MQVRQKVTDLLVLKGRREGDHCCIIGSISSFPHCQVPSRAADSVVDRTIMGHCVALLCEDSVLRK